MKIFKIPYGHSEIPVNLPDNFNVDWIAPPHQEQIIDPEKSIKAALLNPISGRLNDFRGISSVAIAINDKTRPVPHHFLLPPLLDQLEDMGIPAAKITLFIATGTHTPMSEKEITHFLPRNILDRVKVVSHDVDEVDNFENLGTTSRGTPIIINRMYYQSGLRLVVGDIELHHFAGFSGGVKSAVIGLGSRKGIQHNHSMMIDEFASIGIYEENPLRQDIEEAGDRIGIHFALNAILNENKDIVAVHFGKPRDVMQSGMLEARRISAVSNARVYDVVIASAGGYPKDINFYQAQKAITHACLFCKKGGVIILAAECIEGSGSMGYEAFMQGIHSADEIFEKFSKMGFIVGPHKAVQVARQLQNHTIILLSSINPDLVKKWLLIPAISVEDAVQKAVEEFSSSPRFAILPYATGVYPGNRA